MFVHRNFRDSTMGFNHCILSECFAMYELPVIDLSCNQRHQPASNLMHNKYLNVFNFVLFRLSAPPAVSRVLNVIFFFNFHNKIGNAVQKQIGVINSKASTLLFN